MSEPEQGLVADTLFVAITRPPMRWGVAFEAVLLNLVLTMQVFIVSKNLLVLLLAVPIHGLSALLCARDPRIFSLLILAGRTRLLGFFTSFRYWRAASYGALRVDLPKRNGLRHAPVQLQVTHRARRSS